MSGPMVNVNGVCELCCTKYDSEMVVDCNGGVECPECGCSSLNWEEVAPCPGFCEIGMSSCRCGWQGEYPVSGCPVCHTSFV